jgi:hypothetical protein
MASETPSQFTAEELGVQARGNQTAMILVDIAYVKSKGESVQEWARFVGERFASSWGDARTESAVEVAKGIALNMAAGEGGRVDEISGGERHALVRGEWASDEDLAEFGVTRDDVDTSTEIFRPIAERLGLNLSWSRDSKSLQIELSRGS